MKCNVFSVAGLLFLSGMCTLVYQVGWFREFRLVFGVSTAASAAVLAIFMGGLGLGNALLGRHADRHPNPLALYALLELSIAVTAAVSPLLIDLIRAIYVGLGGQLALGSLGATIVRLSLAALVLGAPTVLMGGTLPAAVRAVTTPEDRHRRVVGLLYGANTLGAVLGAAVSTFFALEAFGTRTTLWSACTINAITSLTAFGLSRRSVQGGVSRTAGQRAPRTAPPTCAKAPANVPTGTSITVAASTKSRPRPNSSRLQPGGFAPRHELSGSGDARLVYTAAGTVGFAFFLMELVWYRMLGPLLGGTTFTFGLILGVALFGIGLGGSVYTLLFTEKRVTLRSLATTCALEAAFVAYPFALGDHVAIWTAQIHQTNTHGFGGEVWGWTAIASLVILPAAFLSGLQFPLLIALLGRGVKDIGKQTGLAVAWNTVGAILGSLAGGFGLLPLLSAPGAWRAAAGLLALLSVALLCVSLRMERRLAAALLPLGGIGVGIWLLFAQGPTAVWRHGSIGAARACVPVGNTNELRKWENAARRKVLWEADGVESSIAIGASHGLAFIVNGKSDGNAIVDTGTQIMLGLVGALLHPDPKTALVVGLGTGETAGWLAEVPSVERVDVVELEPAIDEMARRCRSVNHDVLRHPKVRRIYNDAREVLLTSPQRYDLIVSEPSNPYRSGVAGLFTREFYLAGRDRLNDDGLFMQWLQGYEIDKQTVCTVCATLRSVFPQAEVWQTAINDVLLLGSMKPLRYSVPTLQRKIRQEPFRSALACAWRTTDLQGVLAHYLGGPALVAELAGQQEAVRWNTDDRNEVEYGFARTLGKPGGFSISELRKLAVAIEAQWPPLVDGIVDQERVASERRMMLEGLPTRDSRVTMVAWEGKKPPVSPVEIAAQAYTYAVLGDRKAQPLIAQLRAFQATEAAAIEGILAWRLGRFDEATDTLTTAFERLHDDPWPMIDVVYGALEVAAVLAQQDRRQAGRLFVAIREPFAVGCAEDLRSEIACLIASMCDAQTAAEQINALEPNVPWAKTFLGLRQRVYQATGHPLAAQAARDLADYENAEIEQSAPKTD